ncbi:putative FAD dependent oxidoreductase [Trypanosoma vivax]|uniref:L-2-hydroxyglutarate dehydrogenase, mitochondrial n=1 Tax=Trypanosoma vivax (strain Y486) TaxID=1055687 RepID=G0U7M5_TRYVY|nr:hypothetical protein TRVL_00394 [Trypanosoma vivax]KAH8620576.1 putative FAD dependent oxidoreductase [Trypanosoma vivax]CCC51883.1 conserved hypothetical protein [Trypanosoma vivax Y486]
MATKVLSYAGYFFVAGGVCTAVRYRYAYESIPTGRRSQQDSLLTFSADSRREFYDVAVVGGGIVGVATAREIRRRYPQKRVIILEKEADVAQHQSSHNSGVVHAGMYYPKDSIMARLCPRGHDLMMEYCKQHKLPCERVGKLIVAVEKKEVPIVEKLYEQGVGNGVRELRMIYGEEEIKKLEPNVRGVCALYSPDTAIADFSAVARHMLKELMNSGGSRFQAQFRFEALDFVGISLGKTGSDSTAGVEEMVLIRGREEGQLGPEKTIVAKSVITCCGLSNDLLAQRSGPPLHHIGSKVAQTFSFRGRYYQLRPEARNLVSMNVYPAPDASKGLSVGVHFTPTVDERRGRQVIIGPGSAFATHRYGYSPYCFDPFYCASSVFSRGGWVSLASNLRTVVQTYKLDLFRSAFLREAQRLVPSLRDCDIEESFCGVTGIAITEDGKMMNDLAMEFTRPSSVLAAVETPGKVIALAPTELKTPTSVNETGSGRPLILNVRNAPSPAATASMAIAEDIVTASEKCFQWKK